MNIHLCPSPELIGQYYIPGATIIIVDIFRATTTITTAIANGAEGIMPVDSVEACEEIGISEGYLMAAERSVMRCPFAHLGNDPMEYTPEVVRGKRIVMTTTNGTRSLTLARATGATSILIGSLLNLTATLDYCHRQGASDVLVVAAGWEGQMSMEDCLYAGALAHEAQQNGVGRAMGDAALMMSTLWFMYSEPYALLSYIKQSEHYARLVSAGYEEVVPYCLSVDLLPLVVGLDASGQWLTALS